MRLWTRPQTEDEFVWDIERAEIDVAALEGVDAVIHLGGGNIAAGVDGAQRGFGRAIDSTALLVNALSAGSSAEAFVCASAIGIWQPRRRGAFRESEPGHGFLADLGRLGVAVGLADAGGPRPLWRRAESQFPMGLPFKLGLGGDWRGRQFMSWISLQALRHHWMVSARALSGPVNVVAPAPVRNSEFTWRWVGPQVADALPFRSALAWPCEMADEASCPVSASSRPTAAQTLPFATRRGQRPACGAG